MKNKHIVHLTFFYLLLISSLHSQSYYLTKENEKILTNDVSEGLFSGYQELKLKNNKSAIGYEKILGKYDYDSDTFFYLKKYKSKLPLSKKRKLAYIFMSKVTEGEIEIYKGIITAGTGKTQHSKAVWLIEKDSTSTKIHEDGLISTKKGLFEKLVVISKNEPYLQDKLNEPNFNQSIKNMIHLVQNFNIKVYLTKINKKQSKPDGKIVFFRDAAKQSKTPVEFLVNGKSFVLNRKEKFETTLSTDSESLIEITNSNDRIKKLIKPNQNFTKYYEIKLDKNSVGEILRKNANNSFIKTRIKTMKLIEN
ncbi:hypothetical protein J8281_13500 [Aquimarina sp. U1-2]|uniref:hypothetical protein n=1 Tax=Aquimarina sp. U1-2 TaxID=2823141 RepID=UPI001AEC81F1|nr:hypothetical protein [Aquimarina sp. U1-2]MBP2833204.1 hypothetical protein [Aquimarina sp. U1-2]